MADMTKEELAFRLKQEYPQLRHYGNEELVNGVLERRPEYAAQVIDYQPPTMLDHAGEMAQGALSGVKRLGIAGIDLAHMGVAGLAETALGSEGVPDALKHDPAVYKAAFDSTRQPEGSYGQTGQEMGMAAPLTVLGAKGPSGALKRVAYDAALGAVGGEANNPNGGAAAGAIMGGGAGILASIFGTPGGRFQQSVDKGSNQAKLRLLNPGNDRATIEVAEEAIPTMNKEKLLSRNPFRNRTEDIVQRAQTAKSARSAALDSAFASEEAVGKRVNLDPVRQGLAEKQFNNQMPGSQVPKGSKIAVTLEDITDPDTGKIDRNITTSLGITREQVAGLKDGSVDMLSVRVPTSVTHPAVQAENRAYGRESQTLSQTEHKLRAAESVQTDNVLADIPRGLRPTAARKLRQNLDLNKYRGVLPTMDTEVRKKAEKASGDLTRNAINTQLPPVGVHNEPYHHLANMDEMLTDKAALERAGTASERYALTRGLASGLRGFTRGAIALPAAQSTLTSSAYQATNANLRDWISRQISAGRIANVTRLLALLGISATADESKPSGLPRAPQE